MVRQRDVERSPLIAERLPILREAIEQVAHPAIRNRGTVGGSLVHADPVGGAAAARHCLGRNLPSAQRAGEPIGCGEGFLSGLSVDRHRAGRIVGCDRFSPAACGFRLVLHRDRAPAWRFCHRCGGGAARLRARSKDRLRPRRAWRSRSGAAAHDRRRKRRSWVSGLAHELFRAGGRCCGASGGSAGRHPRFFELPAPSHRRVGAPRLGDCGKSRQRARVMTEKISITAQSKRIRTGGGG